MPFQDLALLLPSQSVENLPQMTTCLPEDHFAPSLGDKHNMIFTVPPSSGIGFGKGQTLHPPFKDSHQATLRRILCLNGQTSSSLTGRTSGLPKTELELVGCLPSFHSAFGM